MRRLATLFLLCLLALPARAEEARITFLHLNDVYEISPHDGRGGFAPLKTQLDIERAKGPSLTILSGDFISPSLMSSVTKGQHMIALGNRLGIDLAVPGNHEFDFGPAVLRQRMGESRFPWLAANLFEADGKAFNNMNATLMRDVAGITIGVFGLITPSTAKLAPGAAALRFENPIEAGKQSVASLKAQGAEVIVAVTHLALEDDRHLARQIPGIDLILGGHDHNAITIQEGGTLIHKSGQDAHWLGVVTLIFDKQDGKKPRLSYAWRMEPVGRQTPDPAIAAEVASWEAKLGQALDVTVGSCDCVLDSRRETVRAQESSLASLVADALRESLGADAALLNGGGFRGDRLREKGQLLTRRDLMTEMPFGNVALMLEVSGKELRQTLEQALSRYGQSGGSFPQVSGLSITFDPSRPAGSRIVEAAARGAPLDDGAIYKLATTDYLAQGGDGLSLLSAARKLIDASAARPLTILVEEYLAAHNPARLSGGPRIRQTAGR
jgi:5'-nucleotidase/UDP-sugar diphosphatase